MAATNDCLFKHIEELHGSRGWGHVLDAGTGEHSLDWVASLPSERWTAVTIEEWQLEKVHRATGNRLRPGDRILRGDWFDPQFLPEEKFDTVIADYLLGALDRFSPYRQEALIGRLRPRVGSRLYLVGLEPYPEAATGPFSQAILDIERLRDAMILLANDRCHREYPRTWVEQALERNGFVIEDSRAFPIRYGPRFIEEQLDLCLHKIVKIGSYPLGRALEREVASLRERARELHLKTGGESFGEDYVIAARV